MKVAQKFSCSTTTAHEAVRVLSAAGVVEKVTVIRAPSKGRLQ